MPTIDGALRSTARRLPHAEALTYGQLDYSYAELDAAVDRIAAALAQRGFKKGDRLALLATNTDRFVITFYATLRLGGIIVPINPSSAPPEVAYLLSDSGAKVLAFEPSRSDVISKVKANGTPSCCEHVLALGETDDMTDLFALGDACDTATPSVDITENDDALILYTSGTTGNPKGALFDHHRAMWVGVNCIATCGMRVGDRFLHVAPMYHAAELCIMLIPGSMLGVKHVVLDHFDPALVVDTLESQRITMFFGVPSMFQFMLKVPDLDKRDLSAWRTGLFGAAPMPASTVEELVATLPHVEFMQLCGQTEGGPGGIYSNAQQVIERPDASGRQALLFTQSRVVDTDGKDVAAGETGELILSGETIMKEYWNKPEATAKTLINGWLHTGDLVRVDADGYMTVVDRTKDMIITGGHNVYSVEIENALAGHPAVADCAIIAKPHPEYGESIVAVITPTQGETIKLEDVKTFCRERLSHYKVPHDMVIDEIPRNPSGKIQKHKLRAKHTKVD